MCIGSNSVNQAQDLMTVTKIKDLPNSLLPSVCCLWFFESVRHDLDDGRKHKCTEFLCLGEHLQRFDFLGSEHLWTD